MRPDAANSLVARHTNNNSLKLLPVRRSLIRNSITSEAKKNLYKGSVVRVSASYRPSSKVVGCGITGEGSADGTAISKSQCLYIRPAVCIASVSLCIRPDLV